MKCVVLASAVSCLLATPVVAGEPVPPMLVTLVRSGGDCGSACPEWIAASGRIDPKTPGEFRKIFAKIGTKRLPVVIESTGGSIHAAMTIAQWIRGRQLDVIVGRTTFLTCDAILPECRQLSARGYALGRLEPDSGTCLSACPIVVSGGVRRYIGREAVVGVHAMSTTRGGSDRDWVIDVPDPAAPGGKRTVVQKGHERKGDAFDAGVRTYAQVRKFFVGMGVSGQIIDLGRSVPRDDIQILTTEQIKSLRLATDLKSPREVVFGETPPKPVARQPSGSPLFRKN